ncbi:Crp/Fnr family transcriptional regulator [Brevibacillus massiliensis]|uniref:Crp/Fnr family transcriptional regulator n=1 Tax=Brevibacillus massiliensis TaxID=1118054 RepID=UPI00030DD7C8|nr:Crp/Fnr family transcriptional regulator [Brevibacillus massiliensis]
MLFTPVNHEGPVQNTKFFSRANFKLLTGIMHECKLPAHSHIFMEGESSDKLYFLYSGRVKITKSTENGKEFVLYVFREGDMFGHLDPFHDAKQSFSAKTTEDCVLGILHRTDLELLLWQHSQLSLEMMKWMGLMHRITQTKFRDLMLYGKPGALCSTLIRLANCYGVPQQGGSILINLKLTHSELADYIGSTRESVNRMLNDLKRKQVLAFPDGYIRIDDIGYLKDVCSCENCPVEICRI